MLPHGRCSKTGSTQDADTAAGLYGLQGSLDELLGESMSWRRSCLMRSLRSRPADRLPPFLPNVWSESYPRYVWPEESQKWRWCCRGKLAPGESSVKAWAEGARRASRPVSTIAQRRNGGKLRRRNIFVPSSFAGCTVLVPVSTWSLETFRHRGSTLGPASIPHYTCSCHGISGSTTCGVIVVVSHLRTSHIREGRRRNSGPCILCWWARIHQEVRAHK